MDLNTLIILLFSTFLLGVVEVGGSPVAIKPETVNKAEVRQGGFLQNAKQWSLTNYVKNQINESLERVNRFWSSTTESPFTSTSENVATSTTVVSTLPPSTKAIPAPTAAAAPITTTTEDDTDESTEPNRSVDEDEDVNEAGENENTSPVPVVTTVQNIPLPSAVPVNTIPASTAQPVVVINTTEDETDEDEDVDENANISK